MTATPNGRTSFLVCALAWIEDNIAAALHGGDVGELTKVANEARIMAHAALEVETRVRSEETP